MYNATINLEEKLALFSGHWSPRIIASMNDCHFKLVKFSGDFVWHSHPETDEVFIVLDGAMSMELERGRVEVRRGEMIVVERGTRHRPHAAQECKVMLVERAGTRNTGDAGGEMTAGEEWV